MYQYQPRDCLYREIVSKCPMNVGGRQKVEQEGGRQRWMVFTGEGQSGVLMAFSLFLRLDAIRDKESVVCQFYRMQWNDGIV